MPWWIVATSLVTSEQVESILVVDADDPYEAVLACIARDIEDYPLSEDESYDRLVEQLFGDGEHPEHGLRGVNLGPDCFQAFWLRIGDQVLVRKMPDQSDFAVE